LGNSPTRKRVPARQGLHPCTPWLWGKGEFGRHPQGPGRDCTPAPPGSGRITVMRRPTESPDEPGTGALDQHHGVGGPTGLIACVGCGALVPDIDGPTHRYIGASPGCWRAFGELQARQYEDSAAYGGASRFVVDTYAAQHPGVPGKQSNQSVDAHLVILCLALERNLDPGMASRAIAEFIDKNKQRGLPWLEPPLSLGPITVLAVLAATGPEDHNQRVMQWAHSVWQAWTPHHAQIRTWAGGLGKMI
jgi:hypothetical protein